MPLFTASLALVLCGAGQLPYDPEAALDHSAVIDDSRATTQGRQARRYLAITPEERAVLREKGLVISAQNHAQTFALAYQSIFTADLPVYITSDAIMNAVFESHDDILAAIEEGLLAGELDALLAAMQRALSRGAIDGYGHETAASADEWLAIARALLGGEEPTTVADGSSKRASAIVKSILGGSQGELELFGTHLQEDFSLYAPRGHYTKSPKLQQYFRAMTFLGHAEVRLIEVDDDGHRRLNRPGYLGASAIAALAATDRDRWSFIEQTIGALVGEPDGTSVPALERMPASAAPRAMSWLDRLLARFGRDAGSAPTATDDAILEALTKVTEAPRISGHLRTSDGKRKPEPISFFLFPQRWVVDSEVLSSLVYDRIGSGDVKRMMPSPLDVGYAVFGSEAARALLAPELARFQYADDLTRARAEVDAMDRERWDASLYTLWLDALRGLSPTSTDGLPSIAKTEPWQRRMLNAQLGSWAQLRHDNVLYAKPSSTMGVTCEFPDAYVEPYPEHFARLAKLAARGEQIVRAVAARGVDLTSAVKHYAKLGEVAKRLQAIAETERRGQPITRDDLAFINGMIAEKDSYRCGEPPVHYGWYPELHFNAAKLTKLEPPIIDVHTQPTDEHGAPVGRVLHVATGLPRLMFVTIDAGGPPRAFVGVVFSYHEVITKNFHRLTDELWRNQARSAEPVKWMRDLVR